MVGKGEEQQNSTRPARYDVAWGIKHRTVISEKGVLSPEIQYNLDTTNLYIKMSSV